MPAARLVSAVYLALLFAFCVWRASTQAFSTDEAHSYRLYVGAEPFHLFRQYDANLHLLHTWLCWVSVRVFGLSELSMRLPSLAGAAIYFAGVFRLCSLTARSAAMFAVGVALLTVNPLVLDHMVVARGYGLALAFFVWAFSEGLRAVRPRVAVLIALTVASNLVFLFPCAALIVAMAFAHRDWRGVLRNVAAPAAVLMFLAWVLPLSMLEPGQFYFGSLNLTTMNQTLIEMTVGSRHVDATLVNGLALAALCGAAALWWRNREDRFASLAGATFALAAAAIVASYYLLALPLPWGRTGIYFLFFAPLCLLAAGRWAIAPAVLLSVAMASGIRADRFQEWPFDATSREVMQAIAQDNGGKPARIVATSGMDLALELYARKNRYGWAETGQFVETADYYVLEEKDGALAKLGLRPIYRGRTGVVLARKP